VGHAGSQWALYEYVNGRPVTLADPSGRNPVAIAVGVAGGIIFACAISQQNYANKQFYSRGDKWRHCWTSCRIAKICGAGVAELAGLLKEVQDIPALRGLRDAIGDLRANQQCIPFESNVGPIGGWICSIYRESCEDCCDRKVR
jgi:hypothetical protein